MRKRIRRPKKDSTISCKDANKYENSNDSKDSNEKSIRIKNNNDDYENSINNNINNNKNNKDNCVISNNSRDPVLSDSMSILNPLQIFGLASRERPWPRKQRSRVYYSTDLDKTALISNFEKRGWKEVPAFDGEWNLYWAAAQNCRYIFGVDHPYRMRPDQIINHFPNSHELSRKDRLVNNIKRYRKDLERKGHALAKTLPQRTKLGIGGTRYMYLDIIPMTFVLPADYNLFVEHFKKNPASTWIVKPSDKSQGVGIYLINELSRLKKFAYDARSLYPHFHRDTFVVSKYIDNPLLIGGKKFDLRLFVLVTSYRPIKAYLFNDGFCRFCTQRYDHTELDNVFMHLTNVSIQKNNKEFNCIHGCKWSIHNLWLYLDSIRGEGVSELLSRRIHETIRLSLDAVAPVIANDRHCFEVYGYDIIIDNDLKPWLIEINTSPSITSTTKNDCTLKTRLLDNVLDVVLPPSGMPNDRWDKVPTKEAIKNFTQLKPIVVPTTKKCPKKPLASGDAPGDQTSSTKDATKETTKEPTKETTKEKAKETTKEKTKEATKTQPPGGPAVKSAGAETLSSHCTSNTLVAVKPKRKLRRRKRRSQSVPKPNST